jgi:hypothetical protein
MPNVFQEINPRPKSTLLCIKSAFSSFLRKGNYYFMSDEEKNILIDESIIENATILRLTCYRPDTTIHNAMCDEPLFIYKLNIFEKIISEKCIEFLHTVVSNMCDYPRNDETVFSNSSKNIPIFQRKSTYSSAMKRLSSSNS